MPHLSIVLVCSAVAFGAPPALTGTNGAGTVRTWTAFDGEKSDSIDAAFLAVRGGVVTLGRTVQYDVNLPVSPYKPNQRHREKVQQTVPLEVPLATLSASDRRWIEQHNPVESSLTEKSQEGAVGTLAPKNGAFFITQVLADENQALVQYLRKGKVLWTFCLQSRLVPHLKPMTEYESISCNIIPDFNGLPQNEKERYGIDFRITKKCPPSKKKKDAETVDLVEDHR